MNPICVAHLILSSFMGGPERQILAQARHLDWHLFRTVLCAFTGRLTDTPFLAEGRRLGLPTVALPTAWAWDLTTIRRTAAALRRLGAHILVTSGCKPNFVGHLASRLVRIPHVVISRGWMGGSPSRHAYELADRFLVRFADRVVATCEVKRRELAALGVPRRRLVTIYNAARDIPTLPLSRTQACAELGVAASQRIVATSGRLDRDKGHRFFLAAAARVAPRFADARFVLIGDGTERDSLELQARRLGLGDRARFTGRLETVDHLTPHFDLYVHSSIGTDTIPNAVFEALACARPVVATDVGSAREIVRTGETGILVPRRDAGALARAICAMLSDPLAAAKMGERGRTLVKTQYTFERLAKGYGALYLELARNGGRVHA